MKIFISKLLGYLLFLGAVGLKVPQIIAIWRAKSGRGLAISMYYLEVAIYTISIAYSYTAGAPFSTYGDLYPILLQDFVIIALLKYYGTGEKKSKNQPPSSFDPLFSALVVVYIATASILMSGKADELAGFSLLALLQASCIPLGIASRVPQIITNFKNKDTGELSFLTFALNAAGSTARVATSFIENPDPILLVGYALSACLNWTIAFQILILGNSKKSKQS